MAYEADQSSSLQQADLLGRLKAWWKADSSHSSKWRKEAKEDFDFVAGHGQWTPEERAALESSERVPITFNRTLGFIKAVAGTEINGRHEVRYIPRTQEDTKPNELLTAASQWMSDGCDAEDEESEAFQNAMTCGMGFSENRLDYELDPDGMYVEESINPLEMWWDCKARKKNLVDARRMWRVRKMLLSDARDMFKDVPDDDLDARWAIGASLDDPEKTEEEKRRREENAGEYDDNSEVIIVQVQWWEREPYWLVADPATGQKTDLSEDEYKTLVDRAKQLGIPVKGVQMQRRAYKQAFVGNVVLEVAPAPCKDHFSWACITGEPDKNAGTWYGLVRVARDPQKWANKWLVQSLHILNSSAKGGIMAEADAFEDQRQAEESWAKNDRITWMKRGSLSGAGGAKIQPKPPSQFPAGYFQLMNFAFDAVPQVLGINMELMGMRDVNQPGVLEAQRKQAAMTILATMFDSLRRFRKQVGRIRLYYIQEYLSDGRLIRVVGQEGAQALPLIREKTLGQYDVIVDDAPTSPNQKEANWAIIVSMLPAFKDKLVENPELAVAVLEHSPLPSGFVEKVKSVLLKPNPQAEKAAQLQEAAAMAQIGKDQASAKKSEADAAATFASIGGDPSNPEDRMPQLQKLMTEIVNGQAQAKKTEAETIKTQVETAMIPAQMEMDRQNQMQQNAIKAKQAERKPEMVQ